MTEAGKLLDELSLLDPKAVSLWIDDYEDLHLRIGEAEPLRVKASRTFPLTNRDRLIRLVDSEDEEVGLIAQLDELDTASQSAVRASLERQYLIPQITRIHAIQRKDHVPTWEVDTDRGPRTIEIRSTRSDIRVVSEHHIVVKDADGNQYEIPDTRTLDAASRLLIERSV